MKKNLLNLLGLGLVAATLSFQACTPDPCKDVTCNNGGTCIEGVCDCPSGYEGTNCETLSATKFVGSYVGAETCTVGTDNYTMTVAASSTDATKVVIGNVYNQGVTLTGSVAGTALTIPSQSVTIGTATYTFSGSGTYTASTPPTLKVDYSITGTPSNTCTFTGVKQ